MKRLLMTTMLLLMVSAEGAQTQTGRIYAIGDSLTAKADTAKLVVDLPAGTVGYFNVWFQIDTSLCNGQRPKFTLEYARGMRPIRLRDTAIQDTILQSPAGTQFASVFDSIQGAFGVMADTAIYPTWCERLYLYMIEEDTLGLGNTAGKNYVRMGITVQ